MAQKAILSGTVHTVPPDVRKAIAGNPRSRTLWQDITPLARNEWICWITSAKKSETRVHRIAVMHDKFKMGERRPCCWAGCPHRGV
ncbi:MAG: YdeI/OmpD-associated family protein [Patescibacteria group bacterium]